jgi:hypothetical protein
LSRRSNNYLIVIDIFCLSESAREDGPPLTLEQLGQQRGLTRERIRNMLDKVFTVIRKTFGPRIPRLLDLVRRRCFSDVCPLTPKLLKQWCHNLAVA